MEVLRFGSLDVDFDSFLELAVVTDFLIKMHNKFRD